MIGSAYSFGYRSRTEAVLVERGHDGPLKRDGGTETAVPVVDGEVARDASRHELAEHPQPGRKGGRHADQRLGLLVAGKKERGRAKGVLFVVLGVARLTPLQRHQRLRSARASTSRL